MRGSVKVGHFLDEAISDPGILEMINKITLKKSPDPGKFLAARVMVKTVTGRSYEAEVGVPKGDDLFTPLTREEKRQKFIDNVVFSGTIPLEKGKKALGLLERLEDIDDITRITRLLVV